MPSLGGLLPGDLAWPAGPQDMTRHLLTLGWRLLTLGWRPIGFAKPSWQVRPCADVAEAPRIAADLARSDGGGRWRVYAMLPVTDARGAGSGSTALACAAESRRSLGLELYSRWADMARRRLEAELSPEASPTDHGIWTAEALTATAAVQLPLLR